MIGWPFFPQVSLAYRITKQAQGNKKFLKERELLYYVQLDVYIYLLINWIYINFFIKSNTTNRHERLFRRNYSGIPTKIR